MTITKIKENAAMLFAALNLNFFTKSIPVFFQNIGIKNIHKENVQIKITVLENDRKIDTVPKNKMKYVKIFLYLKLSRVDKSKIRYMEINK